jgi:large subunit ribosomal protein L17
MPGIRKLGKPADQRMAMLKAMVTYLLEHGQITTTVSRAKEVAPLTDKMITLAKRNDMVSYRQALAFLTKEDVAHKLFHETAAKYSTRDGGYTRVVRIGPRRGDAAEWPSSNWCKKLHVKTACINPCRGLIQAVLSCLIAGIPVFGCQRARNHHALNLICPLEDLPELGVPHQLLNGVFTAVSITAPGSVRRR